jgi:hypothetical protein
VPTRSIDFRFSAAPDMPLTVRALQGKHLRAGRWQDTVAHYIAEALVGGDGERVVGDWRSLRALRSSEFAALREAVDDSLWRICPTFSFSDDTAWNQRLSIGLLSSGSLAHHMVSCFDVVGGEGYRHARPDRYFGRPACELLDGHVMVFAVVCEWMNQRVRARRRR